MYPSSLSHRTRQDNFHSFHQIACRVALACACLLIAVALVASVTSLAGGLAEERKGEGAMNEARPASASPALLATITVNSTDDVINASDGKCTLREAITAANLDTASGAVAGECVAGSGDDTINITVTGTITIQGTLTITTSMSINGPVPDQITISRDANAANFRIFTVDVASPAVVNLFGLRLSGGRSNFGGAVSHTGTGTLNITGTTISNSRAIFIGGAIINNGPGTVALLSCFIHDNTSQGLGGAIGNLGTMSITFSELNNNTAPAGDGGAIINTGTLSITNSPISNNSALGGGGIENTGTLTITGSTLSHNVSNFGGAIENLQPGTVTLTNSTLSGNTAGGLGGAIDNGAAAGLNIINSTIADNFGGNGGGGIYNENTGTVQLKSTIVARNTSLDSSPDLRGEITSQGHNLIGNNSASTITSAPGATGDRIGTPASPIDPLLAPLGIYRVFNQNETHALLPGSPAIDAGESTLTTDQRGLPRPVDLPGVANASDASDIGSYETQSGEFITVNSLDGSSTVCNITTCTLRGAIAQSNFDTDFNIISFSVTGTINLPVPLPVINRNVVINGPGANLLTIRRDSGAVQEFRIFTVSLVSPFSVTFSGLTISNGRSTGGAISVNGGVTVNVVNSIISGNSSPSFGGGISNPGGILNLTDSIVSNNSAGTEGGGIANREFGTTTVTRSTVSNNSAQFGGGISNRGKLVINRSTVSNNSASDSGGGIDNFGPEAVSVNLINSTVSGNTAVLGGGIYQEGQGTTTVTSSTVTKNSASLGGGIFEAGTGSVRLRSSIIALNTATILIPDLHGDFISEGRNLIGIFTTEGHNINGSFPGSTFTPVPGALGDQLGTPASPIDPLLAPLGNYGGPTQTHALRPGSPAIDHGDDAVQDPPFYLFTDQRGFPRKLGALVDIGAVEFVSTDAPGGVFRFLISVFPVAESGGSIVITVSRLGNTTTPATVDFSTTDASDPAVIVPCSTVNGVALSRCDFLTAAGTLAFAPGETSKTFTIFITNDSFVEGTEDANITLSNPTGGAVLSTLMSTAILRIFDDIPEQTTNPIDDARFFVRQQYLDFLNREPDQAGWDFWTDNITKCNDPARRPANQTVAQCIDQQRVSTSSAFFLSPEFQATGGFVYQFYKGSLPGQPNYDGGSAGRFPTFIEFIRDVEQVSEGILVGGQISAAVLEANRARFANEFVNRPEFKARYDSLSNDLYVQALTNVTGIQLSTADRTALVNGLNNMTETRATVLRKIVDGSLFISEGNVQFTTTYGKAFLDQEFRRKFVLMEYFGYLRRNPDTPGFNHWLSKLNAFNGDFFRAEMVRSFVVSPEYRGRFGQP